MVRLPDADDVFWHEVREDIRAHVDDILRDWERITSEEPWMSLPEHHRLDALPLVARTLCDAALTRGGGTAEAYRRFVSAAAEHGETRRKQGFAKELLFTEHYLLRQAIWRYVRAHHLARAHDVLVRMDAAVTSGTRASLIGFHRGEFEARGRWPAVLEEVAAQAPVADE